MKAEEIKYLFGNNINGSGKDGIIDIKTFEVICYCTKEQSKLLLEALNTTPPQQASMSAEEIMIKHLINVNSEYTKEGIKELLQEDTDEGVLLKTMLNAIQYALNQPVKQPTSQEIAFAANTAYDKAGNNAFFENGFTAGVEFGLKYNQPVQINP